MVYRQRRTVLCVIARQLERSQFFPGDDRPSGHLTGQTVVETDSAPGSNSDRDQPFFSWAAPELPSDAPKAAHSRPRAVARARTPGPAIAHTRAGERAVAVASLRAPSRAVAFGAARWDPRRAVGSPEMDDPETLVVRVVPDGGGAAEDTLRAPPSAAPDGRGVLDDASASRSRRQTSRRRSLRAKRRSRPQAVHT